MKNIKFIYSKIILLSGLLLLVTMSCERELSDEVEFATNSNAGAVFIDAPIGLGTNFYFPYSGSKPDAVSFEGEGYESEYSLRIDVPNADDPEGSYAGGIFRVDGAGRDLTGYDALTFWAKASQGVNISDIGFGIDFIGNKYAARITGVSLGTNWVKYIVPIPDPSKLTEERGMFQYAAGTEETGGFGYTIWIDELKFEKLGTIGAPKPVVFDGEDRQEQTFIGTSTAFQEEVIFNLPSGLDVKVFTRASYFDYTSSVPSVIEIIEVDNDGAYDIEGSAIGIGTSVITASLAGVQAEGSLTLEVLGEFETAPVPPARNPANVISVFSDAYNNVPVDYYNGFFAPFQTTQGQDDISLDSDNIISYTDLNFVAIGTFLDVAPVNANDMTHLHVDINVREAIQSGDFIKLQLLNNVGGLETSGEFTVDSSQLLAEEWVSLDIPLDDFAGLTVRNQLGLIFFITDATIENIYVDNVYYYKE